MPAWSEWIIGETWRHLTQQWIERHGVGPPPGERRLRAVANEMMRFLVAVMRLYSLRGYAGPDPWPELTDLDDAPIWQTAVAAGARYVVSNNTRHFPPLVDGRHVYRGVQYVTALNQSVA